MFGGTQKRLRVDGQVSRPEYDAAVRRASPLAGLFPRASPSTLASRRRVTPRGIDRRSEFYKQIRALNQAFAENCRRVQADASNLRRSLGDLAGDYLSYAAQIEARFVRKAGEVLTFGNGDCGQLAHGTDEFEQMVVRVPRRVLALRDRQITMVACGGLHNLAVTASGEVLSWGCNDDGSIGRQGDENFPAPVEGLGDDVICGVAAGDGQSLLWTLEGKVWGFGCYKDGEGKQWFDKDPGNPDASVKRMQRTPIRIGGLDDVTSIVCGGTFNAAILADGTLRTWGLGENGEMGRDCPKMRRADGSYDFATVENIHLKPHEPSLAGAAQGTRLENVRAVGCGAYHLLVVAGGEAGAQVYATGMNNYGQLGLGPVADDDRKRLALTPLPALRDARITAVAGGLHHSLAMSAVTGAAYAWGRGDYGQLGAMEGKPKPGMFAPSPVRVKLPAGATAAQIAAGSHHNLLVTEKKALYTWGYGDMAQLGHGGQTDQDELKPRRVAFEAMGLDGLEVLQVGGGGQHSVVVGETKHIG